MSIFKTKRHLTTDLNLSRRSTTTVTSSTNTTLTAILSNFGSTISGSNLSISNNNGSTKNNSNTTTAGSYKNEPVEMMDIGQYRRSILQSYTVRFIGSTPLRRRQTYPMLDWLITDLLYQSKCIGLDLSVCITNCLMKENNEERMEQFKNLKQQLTEEQEENKNGLLVQLNIVSLNETDCSDSKHAFQVYNPSDGQHLLRHNFDRIFFFGKYYRQPSLFYYIHKSSDDVINSVPTVYLFQANNYIQLSEICFKFNELRPKLFGANCKNNKTQFDTKMASDDFNIYNPLLDNNQINMNSNCFEVRLIGSLLVSQKRFTPLMIDKAVEKLEMENGKDKPNADNEQFKDKTILNCCDETKSLDEDNELKNSSSTKPTVISTTGLTKYRRQYRKNRFLVKVIEENDLDLNDEDKNAKNNENNLELNLNEKLPTVNDVKDQNRSIIGDNVTALSLPPPPPSSLSSSTASSSTQQNNNTLLFIIGAMDICLISTENHQTVYTKIFANISHCSQASKRTDHFGLIVREPFNASTLPNTHSLLSFSKAESNSTGDNSMAATNNINANAESYVLHIFQCQAESIVNDLLGSLQQSFNNAFRHHSNLTRQQSLNNATNSTTTTSASPSLLPSPLITRSVSISTPTGSSRNLTAFCQNCPMNWFHQLCLDIYGLDDVKIFAMLLHRIRHGSSERRWQDYYTVFEYLQLERLEQKVDLLIIMLKARVEKMQRYHEIRDGQCHMDKLSLYEQIEQLDPILQQYQQQKSTLSLNRLEGLRLMAKSSLTNTFDAFRKRNKNYQSNENFDSSKTTRPTILTDINMESSSANLDNDKTVYLTVDNCNNKTFHRRNTVAECCTDKDSGQLETLSTSSSAFSLAKENDSKIKNEDKKFRQNNQLLMDIYIKSSSGNITPSKQFASMHEINQTLNQLFDKKPAIVSTDENKNNLSKIDAGNNEDEDEEFDEDDNNINEDDDNKHCKLITSTLKQEHINAVQTRHRLFRRIRKSLKPFKTSGNAAGIELLINNDSNNPNDINNGDNKEQQTNVSINKARQLWNFAIQKQIQLLKEEKNRLTKLKGEEKDEQSKKTDYNNIDSDKIDYNAKTINDEESWTDNTTTTNTISCSVQAPTEQIIDRIVYLYPDLPSIETQSQLEMNILQWRTLIEMFESYCHNNPINNYSENNSKLIGETRMKTTAASESTSIHWWSHFESSIVDALRLGVPKEIRLSVWKFLAKYRRYHNRCNGNNNVQFPYAIEKASNGSLYRSLLKQLAVHQHAIFVDLGRTFPTVPYFAESMGPGQLSLYNLLKAYSLLDKEVEYCQGLSFVAGILLLHMNEEDAFDQLCYVLYDCGLREQYKPSMEALQMQMYQLNRLLYDLNRPLYDHLDSLDISPTLYAAPSFLTLFASQFPIAFVCRVFDLLMFYGLESIFRIFYHLIDRIKTEILAGENIEFESIMELMRTRLLLINTDEMTELINKCLDNNEMNRMFQTRLQQYRLEYKILQEEFLHLNQINKLAVEKLLKQQQKIDIDSALKRTDSNKSTVTNATTIAAANNNNNNNNADNDNDEQKGKRRSKMEKNFNSPKLENTLALSKCNLADSLECLREENRRLRLENEKLNEQNEHLRRQIEELSIQIRRQSH